MLVPQLQLNAIITLQIAVMIQHKTNELYVQPKRKIDIHFNGL